MDFEFLAPDFMKIKQYKASRIFIIGFFYTCILIRIYPILSIQLKFYVSYHSLSSIFSGYGRGQASGVRSNISSASWISSESGYRGAGASVVSEGSNQSFAMEVSKTLQIVFSHI